MGHLEKLLLRDERDCRYEETPQSLERQLEEVKEEVRRYWESHKISMHCLSDKDMEDNPIEMLLFYLLKKGILKPGW
ncbi:MAG: hypothetical protein JRJ03_08795 [Deltaproteobacteria bacterium]|nr:hypothetical protein [Deltaproteobacteria bacterium]